MVFTINVGRSGSPANSDNISRLVLQNQFVTIVPGEENIRSARPGWFNAGAQYKYSYAQIADCMIERGELYSSITLKCTDGKTVTIKDVANASAGDFCWKFYEQQRMFARSKRLESMTQLLEETRLEVEKLFRGDERISEQTLESLRSQIPKDAITGTVDPSVINLDAWSTITAFRDALQNLDQRYIAHNRRVELRDNAHHLASSLLQLAAIVKRAETFFSTQHEIPDARVAELCAVISAFTDLEYDATIAGPDVGERISYLNTFSASLAQRVKEHNVACQVRRNLVELQRRSEWLRLQYGSLQELESASRYLRRIHIAPFLTLLDPSSAFWQMQFPGIPEDRDIACYGALQRFVSRPDAWRSERNARFVEGELQRTGTFFSAIKRTLNREQRLAAIVDDNATRVLAGAGTGKTTTLVAKASYLIKILGVEPQKILAITYNNNAKDEIKARFVASGTCADVEVSTIHALGNAIVGESFGAKATVAPWVGPDGAELFNERAENYIKAIFGDASLAKCAIYFMLLNEREAIPGYAFASIAQYHDYVRRVKPISLKAEPLKSVQEVIIANFLYLHGIEYRYEDWYTVETADSAHAQYRPDFYLPDYDIYIEHYGIDRKGNTAPGIDPLEYRAGMAWKRHMHVVQGTDCIETFSYEASEGILVENLSQALRERGIPLELIDGTQILERLAERSRLSELAVLLRRVAPLWKERDASIHTLAELYADDPFATMYAVPVLERLLALYDDDLRRNGYVDYSDMIIAASDAIANGKVSCSHDVVMLDEAQDLSPARARLIKAYLDAGPDVRFVAVGDDWQSIYRFAGSRLATFVDFEETFGPGTTTLQLSRTHRFNASIEKPTSKFAARNHRQTQRTLESEAAAEPALHFLSFDFEHGDQATIALDELDWRYGLTGQSVLFVFRTGKDRPDMGSLRRAYPQASISAVSAHSAKGLEKDFVVVLEANASWKGFPTIRPADPIIEPLLPPAEEHQHAEERRLFYVACTRGIRAAVVCFRRDLPAPFVEELFTNAEQSTMTYCGDVDGVKESVACRCCGLGRYELKSSGNRTFIGCSRFPACRETAPACPDCGGIVTIKEGSVFYCSACGQRIGDACPICGRGWIIRKSGRFGEFFGCSRWHPDRMGCNFSRSVGGSLNAAAL